MIANNLVVTGQSRLLNKLYCSSGIDATGNTSISNGGLVIRGTYDNLSTCGQLTLFNSSGSGLIVRNDINYTYFLITKSNTDLSFNSLRPMHINMSSGLVSFNHGISVTNVSAGTATFSGLTTHNGGITVNGTTATTSLTASTGLFINCQVLDVLRTTKWELNSTQALGGSFLVSPTIFFSSSTTATISAISGTTVTMAIKDSASITSNSAGGHTWPSGAKVKLCGRLGNVALGTCTGTLTTAMNATAGTITLTFTFSDASSLSVKSYAASEIKDLSIMMYNNGTYPVGIAMTSYGTNGYSYIDVYAGSSSANNPNVRIGNLQGLPALSIDGNSTTFSPQGYGVYTDNGYFKGRILANAGIIGGFTLSSNSIQSGTFGTSGSVMMCTGSSTAKSIANSAATVSGWCFTAGTKFGVTNQGVVYCSDIQATGGKIGGYTLSTYNLIGNNVGISSQSGYEFAFWAGSNTSSSAPFRVGHEGTLYCTQLNATGGTIGSFKITGEYLCSNPDKVGLSATNANWAFYAGYNSSTQTAPFRVTNSGTLYCTDIQATGGKIGRYTITSTYIYTGEGSNQVGIGGNQAFWAGGTSSDSAPFRVSYGGALVATNATITGKITSSEGSIGGMILASNAIYSGTNSMSSTTAGIYLGTGGFRQYSSASAYVNIASGKITAKGADISGSITATSITASQYYSIYTGSTSTRFVYYTGTDLRIGLPTNKTGDLSDLGAGLYLYADGTTSVAGDLTADSARFGSISTTPGGISCAGDMSVGGQITCSYSGVGGLTINGTGTTTGIQITRTDTKYGLRVGMSSSGTQGIWACDYNKTDTSAIIYRIPTDTSATTYLPGRIVMASSYGTGNPPSSGTLVKGMIYFKIVS